MGTINPRDTFQRVGRPASGMACGCQGRGRCGLLLGNVCKVGLVAGKGDRSSLLLGSRWVGPDGWDLCTTLSFFRLPETNHSKFLPRPLWKAHAKLLGNRTRRKVNLQADPGVSGSSTL